MQMAPSRLTEVLVPIAVSAQAGEDMPASANTALARAVLADPFGAFGVRGVAKHKFPDPKHKDGFDFFTTILPLIT